jgi:hypothetical protein
VPAGGVGPVALAGEVALDDGEAPVVAVGDDVAGPIVADDPCEDDPEACGADAAAPHPHSPSAPITVSTAAGRGRRLRCTCAWCTGEV